MLSRAPFVFFSLSFQGDVGTTEFRMHFKSTECGTTISPWHDLPLYNEDGTVNFVCEIPKETSAKMEVATVRRTPLPSPNSLLCKGKSLSPITDHPFPLRRERSSLTSPSVAACGLVP